ncbi:MULTISPECIES: hypothetical protein [unclassified Streptomyces]|uniref:hypothetical protein n=1 Tax=unclassified Streptomyces TaxID=2593676 RepID=UPI0036529675
MRHPLHVALPLSATAPTAPAAGRHRKPRRESPVRFGPGAAARIPAPRRLAAGLGLAGALIATALTAVVDPAAPVAPDRVPARQSSTFAQVSGD